MKKNLKIYTDGGCSGNPGPGGWAFVILDTRVIAENRGAEKNTTNNRMELTAVISALETVQESALSPGQITIYTDSQYVQKGITEWISGWKQKGWKTSGKEAVKNQDLWRRLDDLAGRFSITWTWLRGHAGDIYNEYCDRRTREAIASLGRRN
ncbi:MAG: ribonuclease HI [Treponema sp.]|jgi:ribonuclease HI|nr:ribonuclease HI [Treponema sp.]